MGIKYQIAFILTTLWRNRTTSTRPYPLSIPWESVGGCMVERKSIQEFPALAGSIWLKQRGMQERNSASPRSS